MKDALARLIDKLRPNLIILIVCITSVILYDMHDNGDKQLALVLGGALVGLTLTMGDALFDTLFNNGDRRRRRRRRR